MPSYRVRREAGEFDPEKQRRTAAREAARAEREAAAQSQEAQPETQRTVQGKVSEKASS